MLIKYQITGSFSFKSENTMSKKNVLITGATGNLGTAVCSAFVEAGYHVIGTVENENGDESHDMENIEFHGIDLTREEKVKSLFEKLKSKYSSLHAAICIAGGFGMSNISNTSKKDIEYQFSLNFLTAFNTAKYAYEWMKQEKFGRIILIGSKPALDGGGAEVLPYAIAKGAVIQLADILNETGPKNGIITSVVAPGIIDTPPNRDAMSGANFEDWVTPEAIAGNILHLVSKEANALRQPVLRLYNNS